MKKIFINILAFIIYKIVRLIGRLSDRVIIFLINVFNPVMKLFDKEKKEGGPLGEIKEVFTDFPGGSEMIKNIIRESRPSQLLSTVRGILRHHVFTESRLKIDVDPLRKKVAMETVKLKSSLKIGLLGYSYDLHKLCLAYEKNFAGSQITDIGDAGKTADISKIDILEVAKIDAGCEELIIMAMEKRKMISLHLSSLSSLKTLKSLWEKSNSLKAPMRIVYPQLYYPPVQSLKGLLKKQELGEIASLRAQAIIGGDGGTIMPEDPSSESFFSHAAFNHFIILSFLCGPIEKVIEYQNPINMETGGQSITGIKFLNPGRYGMLECVYAPEMFIKSDHYPYALQLELAGTDGLAWVRAGMGELSQSPPILVRVGRRTFPAGVETGMNYNWDVVYDNMAGHAGKMLSGKKALLMDIPEIISVMEKTEIILFKK